MLTFVDTCVLRIAWGGEQSLSEKAFSILNDTKRLFVVSDYLELELTPKPIFHNYPDERDFFQLFLDNAYLRIDSSSAITRRAIDLAAKYNLGIMDAIHYSIACEAKVDEFITAEKPTKPFFQTKELNVSTIYEP